MVFARLQFFVDFIQTIDRQPVFTIKLLYNTDALTEKFACYFTEKISKIREELDIMETVTPSVREMSARIGNNGLDSFEPVTETEVNKILLNLSKKTSSLDVVPTWLIIECVDF